MNAPREHLEPLVVIAGIRTPFTKAFSTINPRQADELGTDVLTSLIERAGITAADIDEVIFGNVATPAHAANIARVIALNSGVPDARLAHTVSRNCASGMESIVGSWHAIAEGRAGLIATGGVESMSTIPLQFSQVYQNWLLSGRRKKGVARLSHFAKFRTSMLKPVSALEVGLKDPTCGLNMGQTAEILAKEFEISREAQDSFALRSHQLAAKAWERCFMSAEVIHTPNNEKTHSDTVVILDNGIRANQSLEALAKLKPAFEEHGTVTAGNSSQLTDGASCLLVGTQATANKVDHTPLGVIRAYSIAGCDPKLMGLGPVYAIDKLLSHTGKSLADFDLIEINEAFAAQVLACLKALQSVEFCQFHLARKDALGEIPLDKLNVNGGAIALGHPLGASANRLVLTLLRALKEQNKHHGLAALCIGGGQGMAMWVERL